MQVWVSVNEADIGNIRPGMDVEFTVDAYQGTVFKGKVKKVRLNATMSQNVVTYIVEVDTDNDDEKLIPYLTANVKFIMARRLNVTNISSAALRFVPPAGMLSGEDAAKVEAGAPEGMRFIYLRSGNRLRPVAVKTGLNAGGRVEITGGELSPGDKVVIAATEHRSDRQPGGQSRSPFMPTPTRRQPRGGGSAANRARAQQNAR